MRFLLDTQVYLWYLTDSSRLTAAARDRIEGADDVFISAASVWEIAIKMGLGKLESDASLDDLVQGIGASGLLELPVTARHAARVAQLPPIHRDPFDRLLVAQALDVPLRLLTADSALAAYSDLVDVIA